MRDAAVSFENLESRTMMSAAPASPHKVAVPLTPAQHVADLASSTHHKLFAAPAKKVVVKPVAPVKTKLAPVVKTTTVTYVDPATTDSSITYKSFAGDPLFSSAGPAIADVTQGYVGDCFLLSTLSSIVKSDPALIRRDVIANTDGSFTVKFSGKTETVNADLPVFPDGRVAYAQLGAGQSLWVAITEKAYAIYKSGKTATYNSINGGWMGDAFAAFGLHSSNVFAATNPKSLALVVQSELKAGDFVTFGTTASVPKDSPFVASHAYEVDGVITTGGVVTGITFRNPWGSDVADDGYMTVTPAQAMAVFGGIVISHA